MGDISQNGWGVIDQADSKYLHNWLIGARTGPFNLLLHRGPAGFILAHYALWYAEMVEPVAGKGDDFGWSLREIPGTNTWSNHASGTAMDLNASKHPSGVKGTLTATQADQIRKHLAGLYAEMIHWGGDYIHAPIDEMHYEIAVGRADAISLCDVLDGTGRGDRLLADNPGQKRYWQ